MPMQGPTPVPETPGGDVPGKSADRGDFDGLPSSCIFKATSITIEETLQRPAVGRTRGGVTRRGGRASRRDLGLSPASPGRGTGPAEDAQSGEREGLP